MNEILLPDDTEERCGLVMADGSFVEIKNIAEDPVGTYDMDPQAALPLIQSGAVVGTWHTHPHGDPSLSGEDHTGFKAWPDLEHYIIGRRDGEILTLKYRVENGLVLVCE